jgi:hypothetical protein
MLSGRRPLSVSSRNLSLARMDGIAYQCHPAVPQPPAPGNRGLVGSRATAECMACCRSLEEAVHLALLIRSRDGPMPSSHRKPRIHPHTRTSLDHGAATHPTSLPRVAGDPSRSQRRVEDQPPIFPWVTRALLWGGRRPGLCLWARLPAVRPAPRPGRREGRRPGGLLAEGDGLVGRGRRVARGQSARRFLRRLSRREFRSLAG